VIVGSPILVPEGASQFLPKLNSQDSPITLRSLDVTGFTADEQLLAFDEYINAERPQRDVPSTNVVLVSVDSIRELPSA
jgi:hypothetical protein